MQITRAEILIAESRVPAGVGPHCKILSGRWFSYYDQQHVTDPKALDIDHMVPLAEAWDSGASQWTAAATPTPTTSAPNAPLSP